MAVPKGGEVYHADDGTVSVVLEDNYDPGYEPPEKEVEEYAKWLGIDVDTEKDLLYIARDGLKAPLPSEWKPCKTDTGEVYYFNFKTGDSIWEHPMDDVFKKRVEDARAELAAGGGKKAKKEKKEKKDKKDAGPAKGSAGFESDSPRSTSLQSGLPDVKPTTMRLGALGSGSGAARPDVSDLLGPSKVAAESGSTGGLGGGSVGGTNAEQEKKFRDKYMTEFAAMRDALKDQQQSELEHARRQNKAALEKLEREMKENIDDAVSEARRSAMRRNDRELQTYEESINRQKEDLRRTIEQLNTRFGAESDGLTRRVEMELGEKKRQVENDIGQRAAQARVQKEQDWQAEKSQIEMRTDATIRDMHAAHQTKVDAARQRETQTITSRLTAVEDDLTREMAAFREQLQQKRVAHTAKLQADQAAHGAKTNEAYAEAEREAQQKEAAVHAEVAATLQAARDGVASKRNQAIVAHEAAKRAVEEQNHSAAASEAASAAAAEQGLRDAARARVEAAEKDAEAAMRAQIQAYESETDRLVTAARSEAEAAARASSDAAAQECHRIRTEHDATRDSRLKEIRSRHNAAVDSLKSTHKSELAAARAAATSKSKELLDEMIRNWDTTNPEPKLPSVDDLPALPTEEELVAQMGLSSSIPVSTTPSGPGKVDRAAVEAAVAAERAKLKAEHSAKLASMKRDLESSRATHLADHRAKAMREIQERLENYSLERSCSPRVGSPAKQPVQSGPTPAELERQERRRREEISDLRRALDRQLSDTREKLEHEVRDLDEELGDMKAGHRRAMDVLTREHRRQIDALHEQIREASVLPPTPTGGPAGNSNVPMPTPSQHLDVRSSGGSVQSEIPMLRSSTPNWIGGFPPQQQQTPMAMAEQENLAPMPEFHQQQYHNQQQQQHPNSARQSRNGSNHNSPEKTASPSRHRGASDRPRKSNAERYEERLRRANDLLRRKKRDLRIRQQELETARSDWKLDMSRAKAKDDSKQIMLLQRVRRELESQAKRLNSETVQVKESAAWLRDEEEKYQKKKGGSNGNNRNSTDAAGERSPGGPGGRDRQQQQQRTNSAMSGSGNNNAAAHADPAATNVLQVLNQIVSKVSSVEDRVMRIQSTTPTGASGAGSGYGSGAPAAGGKGIAEWVNQQQQQLE